MTRTVESPSNPAIAAAVRALRDGARMALEGPRMLREALDAGILPSTVFHVPGGEEEAAARLAAERGAELVVASPRAIERLTDLASARGLLALARPPRHAPGELPLPEGGLALLLDGVQDPSNVGAALRSAEAFGASCALLTTGCASPYGARSLRASAGSAFRLPAATSVSPEEAVRWVRSRSALLLGAEAHGGVPPDQLSPSSAPLVLAIGSEGRGLSAPVEAAVDVRLTLPLLGRVESLNAAVAAGVLLYALAGRKSDSPKTSAEKR
ncbi:MAG: RNA methyltransferase [Acidobacteria bacterium]|nr:MAG: RNA methyltransferase [Acidobacteriota bacterium]